MVSRFSAYLRTGRLLIPAPLETKFNPWHDPEDGRFTFARQGKYFAARHRASASGGGSGSGPPTQGDVPKTGRAARDSTYQAPSGSHDPKNALNHSTYVVKRGDTLTRIARRRKGLTTADLVWLNEMQAGRPLQIGQGIKLPHQSFLDRGKLARDRFLALAHYVDATGGKLPPDVARPPSIDMQIEASGRREVHANGYRYEIDVLLRPRRVSGEIQLEPRSRSRSAQANAGKPDRRITDDGGHYIAARFNGPREWFNHFAQDANFNRGAYRGLEEQWAKDVRARKRVFVEIVPLYRETSMRPYRLRVIYFIDGKRTIRSFPNERTGSQDAR